MRVSLLSELLLANTIGVINTETAFKLKHLYGLNIMTKLYIWKEKNQTSKTKVSLKTCFHIHFYAVMIYYIMFL